MFRVIDSSRNPDKSPEPINLGTRSQVQGSRFRVKDKEDIETPKPS